ncbi:TonB-dependent siderophore receptor [Oleiharenicola lentus]|uniref:TonB-dependent siderophore receptor n=1 Tax=Oleiharenicola lentus TaxID=2508720 RepID=A0A4Q1C7M6_9BACT|nr:TonB-dependent siderophore receptor [Oleiharenicola lentus]RXK54923.1 TonB-dependent siderophore receptor [Oleiharenicola lentus]
MRSAPSQALFRKAFASTAGVVIAATGFALADHTPSYLPPANEILHLDKLEVTGSQAEDSYAIQRSITATKTDTALVDVPQSISVITRELITDQAMLSIGDVTRYVPGVGIAQGEGNRDTPVMRGNSTTADFFVDGVRDDVQYLRDLYNVDRVEVLKGPNAMIFGRGGSGGLLNRVTKQAHGRELRELTLQAGSDSHFRATLDYGSAATNAFAYRLSGLYEDSESYRDGFTLKRHGLNPTFAWSVAPATTLRFGYEYFHDERVADRGVSSFQGRPLVTDASVFFGDPAQSPVEATVNSTFAVLEHRFGRGVTLRNHTRYSVYDKFYQNIFPGAVNATATTVALSAYNQATDRENFFNQTDLEFFAETGTVKHHFLTGLEVARQETDNVRLTGYFETVSPTTTSISVALANPRTTLPVSFRPSATDANNHGVAKTFAVYAQDQVTLLPQLQAIAGLRYERFTVDFLNNRTGAALDSADEMLSPRAGLVFKPASNVSVYASYTMSFVPRAGEQLASLTATNRAFDPEEFNNKEIGVKWDLRPDLAFTAAVYRLDRTNVVITDPADSTKSLLVDGQRAEGVELGLTGRLTKNWSVSGGYAYQDGEILTTQSATVVAGRRLAQLPRHTLSLWNRYDFNRTFGLGLGAIYRDTIFASADNTVTLPSFVRLDAAVFYRLNDRFRAQLNVENILDRHYYASAHSNNNITPGSPRAFRVSLTTSF